MENNPSQLNQKIAEEIREQMEQRNLDQAVELLFKLVDIPEHLRSEIDAIQKEYNQILHSNSTDVEKQQESLENQLWNLLEKIQLSELVIESNVLKGEIDFFQRQSNLHSEAWHRIKVAKQQGLKTLSLARLGLMEIPKAISELINVEDLDLSHNVIFKIENLEGLENLKSLTLSFNRVQKIENLERLKKLTTLNLRNNYIRKIENLSSLESLKTLRLEKNQISKIENLDFFGNLKLVVLNSNSISKIENLNALENLHALDLKQNQISKIENLGFLKNLRQINLSQNQISKIENLSSLEKLKFLDLSDNNLKPNFIIDSPHFFDFIKSRDKNFQLKIDNNPFLKSLPGIKEEDYDPSPSANHRHILLKDEPLIFSNPNLVDVVLPHKLVLIGNSAAGKSSLVDFLVRGELQTPSGKASTEVLDIVEWKESGQPEFLIYDFGGQDFYHATYQMFFSEKASYLLIWAKDSNYNFLKKGDTAERPDDYFCFDANYWLGNIRYLNQTIRSKKEELAASKKWYKNLILVENKIDLNVENPSAMKLADGFGELEQFKISLWKPKDSLIFQKRRAWLKEFLQQLHPRVEKDIRERADAIEDYLKGWQNLKKKKNEWTYDALRTYLKKKYKSWRALDEDDVHRMLHRFSASGLLLWYAYDEKLKDRIWIHPLQLQEEVSEIIMKFKEDEKYEKFKGRIPSRSIARFPKFKLLKDLLLKQQVIFEDESKKGKTFFIIPQALELSDENDPLFQIAVQGLQPSFTIRFQYFMPLGIMNRLIAIFGKLSDQKYYRRYEIVFFYQNAKVLLKCDMVQLTLRVKTSRASQQLWKDIFKQILIAYHRLEFPESPTMTVSEVDIPTLRRTGMYSSNSNFKIKDYVSFDLQISLDDEFFVNYDSLLQARKDRVKYLSALNDEGVSQNIEAYHFDAFMDEMFGQPKTIFISYSHDDLEYRQALQEFLINMERDNLIEVWQDGMIQPGMDWDATIKENLERADIVILLVSQSFIASNYSNEVELRKALKEAESGQYIFPVLLKDCDFENWKGLPEEVSKELDVEKNEVHIGKFQFVPQRESDQRLLPVNQWERPETAWKQIINKLKKLVGKK